MDKQILFLFAALKGFIDWMPVELVSIFEDEFYQFYSKNILYLPLKSTLDFKDNILSLNICNFMMWYFVTGFIKFANVCHNYGSI